MADVTIITSGLVTSLEVAESLKSALTNRHFNVTILNPEEASIEKVQGVALAIVDPMFLKPGTTYRDTTLLAADRGILVPLNMGLRWDISTIGVLSEFWSVDINSHQNVQSAIEHMVEEIMKRERYTN